MWGEEYRTAVFMYKVNGGIRFAPTKVLAPTTSGLSRP
jgi:hypothetical protein